MPSHAVCLDTRPHFRVSRRVASKAGDQRHGAIVEGRRIEVNPATAKATPRTPTFASRRHKSVAEEQELVEAPTRLAEA